jgi:hypothetical protein
MDEKILPMILVDTRNITNIDEYERSLLASARKLLDLGFPDHALLDIWNAAVHNLRKRIELYSIDIFLSAVKDAAGRKRYNNKGDSLEDRWEGVDEAVLIEGASMTGVLSGKAGKALEMINWMRNHASPAHSSHENVSDADVFGLVMILQENLFKNSLPEVGHSPSTLLDPIKNTQLDATNIGIINDQINSFNQRDIRIVFGFLLDNVCNGIEPAFSNSRYLFDTVWAKATEDSKIMTGARYQKYLVDSNYDNSSDRQAKVRLLELLVSVRGIKYIPDAGRALIYRSTVSSLATAKNSNYGWRYEEMAANSLAQFGPFVPTIAFEEIYQEILSVWCGNYWGRSSAFLYLKPFIDILNSQQIVNIAYMFINNERVKNELSYSKPKSLAIALLQELRTKLTIQAHINDVDNAIVYVRDL